MENQSNSNQNCGCGDGGCCTPKKGNFWTRLIFIIIILAAGAIITVKLIGKEDAPPAKCCEKTESPSCCPKSSAVKDSTDCTSPQPEE